MSSINWGAIVASVQGDRPALGDELWGETVSRCMSEDVLGAVVADIIKVESPPTGRGVRVMPPEDVVRSRLEMMSGGGFSTSPFSVAVQGVVAGYSVAEAAEKSGVPVERMHALLAGESDPSLDEMSSIAVGFGRREWFFAEWRALVIGGMVADFLGREPERSVHLIRRMVR